MIYKVDINRWGAFFSVPLSVVQTHLKLSSGEQIKALLYILSQGTPMVDCDEVARTLGISAEAAEECVLYWHSLGVLSIEGKKQTAPAVAEKPCVEIQAEAKRTVNKELKPQKAVIKYQSSELNRLAEENGEIKELFHQAQASLCRPINYSDMGCLTKLYEYYGFPVATIVMLLDYCHSIRKDNMAYIEKVADSWYNDGITDPKDADIKVKYLMEYHSFENELKRLLNFNAKTTAKQTAIFEEWKSLGLSPELIEYAGEISIDKSDKHNISLEYMDPILKRWASENIVSVEEAKKQDNDKKPVASKSGRSNNKNSNEKADAKSRYTDDVEKWLARHGIEE